MQACLFDDASISPASDASDPVAPSSGAAGAPSADAFEAFWQAYPKGARGGKGVARQSWAKALRKATPADLVAAVEAMARHHEEQGTEHRFIRRASTWLNQHGWEDDESQSRRVLLPERLRRRIEAADDPAEAIRTIRAQLQRYADNLGNLRERERARREVSEMLAPYAA